MTYFIEAFAENKNLNLKLFFFMSKYRFSVPQILIFFASTQVKVMTTQVALLSIYTLLK